MREQASAGAVHRATVTSAWLRSLRPDQWIKNAVVFAGLVFGMRLLDPTAVALSLAAFAVFCAASSAVYLLNDVLDLEFDRTHPYKRHRPIASGAVPVRGAALLSAVLAVASMAVAWRVASDLALIVGAYLLLNVVYSLWLKHALFVDVLSIALGFVLRAMAGAAAVSVRISPWLVVCTFTVMLFLALGKRRAEVAAYERVEDQRPVTRGYSVGLLDQAISVVVAATLVSYCLYTLSPEVQERYGVAHLEMTVPFVVYGLFRYLYLVRATDRAQNPTRAVVTDRPIVVTILLWGGVVLGLLYAGIGS